MQDWKIGQQVKVTRPKGPWQNGWPGWGAARDTPQEFTGEIITGGERYGYITVRIDGDADLHRKFGKNTWYCDPSWLSPGDGPW